MLSQICIYWNSGEIRDCFERIPFLPIDMLVSNKSVHPFRLSISGIELIIFIRFFWGILWLKWLNCVIFEHKLRPNFWVSKFNESFIFKTLHMKNIIGDPKLIVNHVFFRISIFLSYSIIDNVIKYSIINPSLYYFCWKTTSFEVDILD